MRVGRVIVRRRLGCESGEGEGESAQRGKRLAVGEVRTGEEFRVPFELDVQLESDGGFPARPPRIRSIGRRASRG